jgi:hypothetical protein
MPLIRKAFGRPAPQLPDTPLFNNCVAALAAAFRRLNLQWHQIETFPGSDYVAPGRQEDFMAAAGEPAQAVQQWGLDVTVAAVVEMQRRQQQQQQALNASRCA